MTAGDAMRQLFRRVGEFARATRDADRQRSVDELDVPQPARNPPPPRGDTGGISHGSTGTFDGIVGEQQREAIVVARLKEFGKVAGLEWDDTMGIDGNLTTWFLDNDPQNFPRAPRKNQP